MAEAPAREAMAEGRRRSVEGPDLGLGGPLLVDAHAHLRRVFHLVAFLEGAVANFRAAAAEVGAESALGCLLLAEAPGEGGFARLRERTGPGGVAGGWGDAAENRHGWTLSATAEPESLLARRPPDTVLLIVAGRQLVSSEGLEVLVWGNVHDLPEARVASGTPAAALVRRIVRSGGIAVVPWGFGKWWFRRGRVLQRLLADPPRPGFFLGDSAGRPRGAPAPAAFRRARRAGVVTLPGTDPLPARAAERTAGGYGFLLEGELPADRPAEALRERLRALRGVQPETFGRRVGVWEFLRAQSAIRRSGRRADRRTGAGAREPA